MNPNRLIRTLLLLAILLDTTTALANQQVNKLSVIYCTDLFHPHDDPDDHFDIACLYAIPEIEIAAIILDQGNKQEKKPGAIPVSQLNHLTGRSVPHAIGLSEKLNNPQDKALGQPDEYQKAVGLILTTLKNAAEPVTIVAVGSLRDVAAAYNRQPNLFTDKVNRLFIFIGEASTKGHVEYNVGLDKNAYIRIMNSGLPVYWIPCFDGGLWKNNGKASYWKASHRDLLRDASDRVMNYFIYALLHRNEPDAVQYLDKKVDPQDRRKVLGMNRNLWCAAVFACAAGRSYVRLDNRYICVPSGTSSGQGTFIKPFEFVDVSLRLDHEANVIYGHSDRAVKIKQFRVLHPDIYPEVMTSVTAQLLCALP